MIPAFRSRAGIEYVLLVWVVTDGIPARVLSLVFRVTVDRTFFPVIFAD